MSTSNDGPQIGDNVVLSPHESAQYATINYTVTIIGLCTTIFRIWDRVRNRRFGNDDVAAIVCTTFQIIFLIVDNLYMENPWNQSPKTRSALHILVLILVQAITWNTKLILSLNLLRIFVLEGRRRNFLTLISIIFVILWPLTAVLDILLCIKQPSWHEIPQPICVQGLASPIVMIIANVLADLVLIITPVWNIWGTKITRSEKIRASAVFLTSVIMTAVILDHEYWILKKKRVQEDLLSVLHTGILLIVANMAVIIPFLLRKCFRSKERERRALSQNTSKLNFKRHNIQATTFELSSQSTNGPGIGTGQNCTSPTEIPADLVEVPDSLADAYRKSNASSNSQYTLSMA